MGSSGVGKTTLARLIAEESDRPFHALSAIHSGVKDVRAVLDSAKRDGMFAGRALLFIDEIHRFSKSQQDSLLGAVEAGTVTLIGATTENPSFEVIPALRSRCQTYVLESLSAGVLMGLVQRALTEDERMAKRKVRIAEHEALLRASGGDARRLLNTLELVVDGLTADENGECVLTNEAVTARVQQPHSGYDKGGEAHYDVVSAFIKSIRASDPNAAVYYLARMVEGGEDPKFIARRLLIAASEDIGNANPTALVLANNTQAVNASGGRSTYLRSARCIWPPVPRAMPPTRPWTAQGGSAPGEAPVPWLCCPHGREGFGLRGGICLRPRRGGRIQWPRVPPPRHGGNHVLRARQQPPRAGSARMVESALGHQVRLLIQEVEPRRRRLKPLGVNGPPSAPASPCCSARCASIAPCLNSGRPGHRAAPQRIRLLGSPARLP